MGNEKVYTAAYLACNGTVKIVGAPSWHKSLIEERVEQLERYVPELELFVASISGPVIEEAA